jgi:hypothetical protein
MTIRFSAALLVLLSSAVHADGKDRIMASRYLRAQFCVERAVGQRWHERYGIPMVMNRWGISEPTAAGLAKGPEALRRAHTRCRAENQLADEPIPR